MAQVSTRSTRGWVRIVPLVGAALLAAAMPRGSLAGTAPDTAGRSVSPVHSYGALPLRFEPNVGQAQGACEQLERALVVPLAATSDPICDSVSASKGRLPVARCTARDCS